MNIALICERLHVLPNSGGVLQQDESDIRRMLIVYKWLDEWREVEMKRLSSEGSKG